MPFQPVVCPLWAAARGPLQRLKVAEIEGYILEALVAKNLANMEYLNNSSFAPL